MQIETSEELLLCLPSNLPVHILSSLSFHLNCFRYMAGVGFEGSWLML